MRSPGTRAAAAVATAALVLTAAPAVAHGGHHGHDQQQLAPRTHFTMAPDGSSGKRPDGAGIPNIDSDKNTIRTYYNATAGIADKTTSPYITEMTAIERRTLRWLKDHRRANRHGAPQAVVFDADDTTLWTYDMEDGAMHFNFDPTLQNTWVQEQRFPATPGMVDLVNQAQAMGYAVFGITGRSAAQEPATLGNLAKVGYRPFDADNFYTKWNSGTAKPDYVTCVVETACTTVEYKAYTRKHIESLGYDITLNVGDQWSDLQGGYADHVLKLPNPTYYLPSADLPGLREPRLSPRTHFEMKPDGSSGKRPDGEGIPNIDSVKSTIRTYYNATAGIADKASSPYITEMQRITSRLEDSLTRACRQGVRRGTNPAVVFDADDTTLWTYDMEDGTMKFNFDPVVQDRDWVQPQRFPATPGMVDVVNSVDAAGCTVIGLTGRNDKQRAATLGNLAKVGYTAFTDEHYFTKWVTGAPIPDYITCAAKPTCTTIEYKSSVRRYVESPAGGGYDVVANVGDQFSDLIGGSADRTVKLPNPTYYLP